MKWFLFQSFDDDDDDDRMLRVFAGLDLLNAPAIQVGREGQNFSLVCSYPNALIMWYQNDIPARITFSPLRVEDEGIYICNVIVISEQGPAAIRVVNVQLLVESESTHTHTHTHITHTHTHTHT